MLDVNIKGVEYKGKSILENIQFTPCEKSFTAVIGRNGSGKSTLISAISSLIKYEGSVTINGRDTRDFDRRELSLRVSAMLQNLKRPHMTVSELVALGRSPYIRIGQKLSKNDTDIIDNAINKAQISGITNSYVDKISGGELRRAYFAMLLAQNTDIVLLDEATAFMDADYERKFCELAKELSKEKTVISVMHNLDFAVHYADNILLLDKGRQLFFGSRDDIMKTNLIEKTFSVNRYTVSEITFFSAN